MGSGFERFDPSDSAEESNRLQCSVWRHFVIQSRIMKNTHNGKFIVIEGIDGSGKSTQTKLLVKRLKKEGKNTAIYDFPQYGSKSAGLIEEYLNGRYGVSKEVDPYRASIFYACDRYDASFKIGEWLNQGKILICDRYLASNIGHQGGKIKNKAERIKFIKWLYDLEYGIFGIPKPNITFILKTSPEFSMDLSSQITDKEKQNKRKTYLGNKKRDIHENDSTHLRNSLNSYLEVAKEFPGDFRVIECIKNKKLLPIEIIHQKIWTEINKSILL